MNILPKSFILKLPPEPKIQASCLWAEGLSWPRLEGWLWILTSQAFSHKQPLGGLVALNGSHPPRSEVLPGLRCSYSVSPVLLPLKSTGCWLLPGSVAISCPVLIGYKSLPVAVRYQTLFFTNCSFKEYLFINREEPRNWVNGGRTKFPLIPVCFLFL